MSPACTADPASPPALLHTNTADPLSDVIKYDTSLCKQQLGYVICAIFLPSLSLSPPPSPLLAQLLFLPHSFAVDNQR